jgi:transposase
MYCNIRQWRRIRRRILEKRAPKKKVARETGVSRRTINKMLAHERPPGYHPRPLRYPKSGPYTQTIDRLLNDAISISPGARLTIRDIIEHLRRDEGFAGCYDSVRNYIRQRARDDKSACERAYDLIVQLPKPRALDFVRFLSRGSSPVFASARIQSLVREVACSSRSSIRPNREQKRLQDIDWMRRMLQKEMNDDTLRRELGDIPDLAVLLQHLHNGRLRDRNRAMLVLATHRNIPSQTICAFLGVAKAFVLKYRNKFKTNGAAAIFAPHTNSNRKIDDADLRNAVFGLLHEPPTNHGINRTSWTMPLLSRVLKENGRQIGTAVIAKMIKAAGYKWRKARIVLTSTDPTYKEKLDHIRSILSHLQPDEAFFSIGEYGPFAIKTKPGRMLVPPDVYPTVPQWQTSRGCLIMTAALELSGNQVTHFYSAKKNTGEMIRLMDVLVNRYADRRKLYLSWDAASWHISKKLFARIEAHNSVVVGGGGPLVETAPLPAGAQFLNVIESVFSGMARAIIHNSDYNSMEAAKAAIDRYFEDRNANFLQHPKRAGKKIWGDEREPAAFSDANNCKDPRYR